MTPDELERAARESGQTDLTGPEHIDSDPPRWMGVLTILVILGTLWIGWMVIDGLVAEYIRVQATMRPNL